MIDDFVAARPGPTSEPGWPYPPARLTPAPGEFRRAVADPVEPAAEPAPRMSWLPSASHAGVLRMAVTVGGTALPVDERVCPWCQESVGCGCRPRRWGGAR